MGRRAYANIVNPVEVSIGIQRLLIGDFPQTWTPARIDLDAPPSGFYDLGAVVEDTPSMKVSREKYQLETGVPMVLQFEATQKVSGTFECQLHSNSWRKLQYGLGNYTAAASYTELGSVTSVTAANAYTFTGTAIASGVAVGQTMVFASASNRLDNPDAFETRVTSIALATNATFYLDPAPTAATSIGTGWKMAYYDYVKQVYGSSRNKYYSLLGVADFIDGTQIVHYVKKASPAAEMVEEIRPQENQRIPLSFNFLGQETTINSIIELVVGERYFFPKNSQF
jgi:hypothetical protein